MHMIKALARCSGEEKVSLGAPKLRSLILGAVFLLSGCGSSMVYVESSNQNSRIDYVVIHATSENFAESLRLLTQASDNPVSSHYLVPAPGDASYPDSRLRIYSLVPEQRRAWHAGVSYWQGEEALNDRSIGIEVVNEFKCVGTDRPLSEVVLEQVSCDFPPYSQEQIDLLVGLLRSILERYPNIDPIDIVAHSDIAIMRKSDPGPLFPWRQLYEAGIGVWPDAELTRSYRESFAEAMPDVSTLQSALLTLGYKVEPNGEMDAQTRFALRAFQLRFRPADYSGVADVETAARLWALLEQYRPEGLLQLVSL